MITVGIPTYNEEKSIANSINSALKQTTRKDEVIVVASGCTDNTVEEIRKVMKKDKRVKLIVEKERKGKASALNLIIKHARGEIIVQTDGDVVISKGAVGKIVRHFSDSRIGGVSGNPIPIIDKNNVFYDWTIMSYRKAHELRVRESKAGTLWHLSGYLLAFRKKALPEVPFAKGAVDAWMGRIIQQNGYKMEYEPQAKVFVKAPTNAGDFVNQKARVRAGYYLLSKQAGKAPRKINSEIFYLPQEILKVPLIRWHKFIFSGAVYLYAWLRGYYLASTNKSLKQIWKTPVSTK